MIGRSGSAALGLCLALGGCYSGGKAIPAAAARSGCAKEIVVVRDDGRQAVLDVCGTYEDWRFDGLDGWSYEGPSADQPLRDAPDTDRDGVPDASDACLALAGAASPIAAANGCPPAVDTDADGVVDASDACAAIAGIANADPKKHGCPADLPAPVPPADGDGDGIADATDACADKPGVANADPTKNGCPADLPAPPPPTETPAEPVAAAAIDDKDGDGILDKDDWCVELAGIPREDVPSKNGCPKRGGTPVKPPGWKPPKRAR